jgi:hypothetical protein
MAGKALVKKIAEWAIVLINRFSRAGDTLIVNLLFFFLITGIIIASPLILMSWVFTVLPNHWLWQNLFSKKKSVDPRFERPTYRLRRHSLKGMITFGSLLIFLLGLEVFAVANMLHFGIFVSLATKVQKLGTALPELSADSIESFLENQSDIPAREKKP